MNQTQLGWEGLRPDTSVLKHRDKPKMKLGMQTIVLKRKSQWDRLFNGFNRLQGITYVSSPGFLLDLFDDDKFDEIDLLIGDGLAESYKGDLTGHVGLVSRLFDHIDEGNLRIRSTKAKVHTKLYILSNEEYTRIICGSPNLSYTASGSRQREYAWYLDVYPGDVIANNFLLSIEEDFNAFLQESDIVEFMLDLLELRQTSGNEPDVDFRLWSSSTVDQETKAIRTIMSDIKAEAFRPDEEASDVIEIHIPKTVKKSNRRFLTQNYGAKISGNIASIPRTRILDQSTNVGMPLMNVEPTSGVVQIGINGAVSKLPQSISPEQIRQGLEDIARYIGLVDRAHCHHPDAMKMNMMETVIFTLAAPFSNEWLRNKWQSANIVNRRGPKHLLIYGDGHNGKTTLFRFMSHLLSGHRIDPISGKQYAKKEWDRLFSHIQSLGSMFPVMVDDIKDTALSGKKATLEGFLKSYFENDWAPSDQFPLLMLNTNHAGMEEWAKTRIRRLDFLVKFKGDSRDEAVLNEILGRENMVFPAFAEIMSSQILLDDSYGSDELALARKAVEELYNIAGLEIPQFFPNRPPDEIYDMDAVHCADRRRYGMFHEKKSKGVYKLTFSSRNSLHSFKSRLPAAISTIVDDTVLVIQSTAEYEEMLKRGTVKRKRKWFFI
jgi:hypothetical protein